jgi:hypothetical protein
MKKVIAILVLCLQMALIVFALRLQHDKTIGRTDEEIDLGLIVMRYMLLFIAFYVFTFVFSFWLKRHFWLRILIVIIAIAGFIIYSSLNLYPW